MEKVQKGNPRGITTKQHVFPNMSISRFTNADGKVSVNLIQQGKVIQCKPENEIFCVNRHWDQRAERGYMKAIEDKFQSYVNILLEDTNRPVYSNEKNIVNEMYALWKLRFHARHNPIPDQSVVGLEGSDLTKDQEEILESKGAMFMRAEDAVIPGRFMTGIKLQMEMDQLLCNMQSISWSVALSKRLELIVPECFHDHAIIPITPTMALVSDNNQRVLSEEEVRAMNIHAIKSSINYWFARDISKCL